MSKGNILEGQWNATVMLKLRARNDNYSLLRNNEKDPEQLTRIYLENKKFIEGIKDPYSVRLSSRHVHDKVKDKTLFAHDYKKYLPKILKHLDAYSAAGTLYHDLNITALCGEFDYRIVQLLVIAKHFLSDGKIGIKANYGLEKLVADLMVVSRAKQIQETLMSKQIQ